MKYRDEYRDPAAARQLADAIARTVTHPWTLMEVCGGQTHAIVRFGRHGIAVMAARDGFGFETSIESDCAALAEPVLALIEAGIAVHCLRDLTRGGLASAAVEIAEPAACAIALEEAAIPVCDEVTAACELLGLDPLHVANEGRFIAFIALEDAGRAVKILRRHPVVAAARVIGEVRDGPAGQVSCRGSFGAARAIDMLSGEQLPRIC